MKNTNTHWNKLELEILEIMDLEGKQTKGSGNQKGDLDIKIKLKNILLMFEAKSEEIPNKNVIIKHNEFEKAIQQAETHHGIPLYVRKDRNNIPIVSLRLKDFSDIIHILLNS